MMMSPFSRCGSSWSIIWSTSVAGLDHQHDAARLLEQPTSSSMECAPTTWVPLASLFEEIVHLGDGAVEDRHFVAVVVHVQDQVLAHDGQADQSDIASCFWHDGSFSFHPARV